MMYSTQHPKPLPEPPQTPRSPAGWTEDQALVSTPWVQPLQNPCPLAKPLNPYSFFAKHQQNSFGGPARWSSAEIPIYSPVPQYTGPATALSAAIPIPPPEAHTDLYIKTFSYLKVSFASSALFLLIMKIYLHWWILN